MENSSKSHSIVVVHNYYQQPGGEDKVFAAEKSLLSRKGHRVTEFVRDNQEIQGLGYLRAASNTVWSWDSQRLLRRLLRSVRPDVVHFHNTFLLISPAAYYVCHEEGVPVVQTLHNYRLLCPGAQFLRNGEVCERCKGKTFPWPGVTHGCWRGSKLLTGVVATMLTIHNLLQTWEKQVDMYIALTKFARRKFIEGGLPANKVVVKPNFIYPDPGFGDGSGRYALFVGRVSQEKGINTLIQAWRILRGIPLKVVGDGPLMQDLLQAKQDDGLEEVEVLGWRSHNEVLALLKMARFLVFPSEWYEGFPMTIVEALACGTPIIASRLGAMAEIVENNRTGFLFSPKDAEDLAAKVEWAWKHPEQMQEMRRESRMEYEQKYTAEQNYEILMAIYEKIKSSGLR